MGDRQRNFAQYATALNQFASFNNDGGGAERSGRERGDGGGGVTAPGSNSSGSSGSSGASHGGTTAAGNAALWGELTRSLQYNNYPGFSTAWQGGSGDMRLYGYGGYGEGQVDGRPEARSENRVEGRRVPSKGETKATPPLPPGMAPGVGSALASLQQLVASGGDAATVYRSLLAARQYAAAAAALGALPTPSSINPAALHAASPLTTHHQQQQQQQQRRQQQQHQQQHHQQQQLQQQQQQHQQHQHQHQQLQQQQAAALVTASTAGLNGEGLAMHNASRIQQASPQDRKFTSAGPTEMRHDDPQPSPGRTRSHALPTSVSSQEVLCPPVKGKEANEVQGVVDGNGDGGSDSRRVQSGSESEGDQRTRHRRKQEQPRRQSVIYPVTAQPEGGGGGGGGGDSSSDDSQGFDVLITRNTVDHRDSPHDSLHSNSPADPALRLPPSREAFPSQGMSQAMSHALAHPFLAAHLNASQLLQMAQPPTTGKADVPSPHSQPIHQLQVRTDLLEPHPKEPESYSIQEPQRPLSQSQITTQEIEINRVRTPPSNTSVDGTTAPVKKRRCSPRYLENDTLSLCDPLGNSTISEVGRSDRGENSVTSVSVSLSGEDSTAHNLSPSIESTPVNGINATSEDVVKNASSSNSNDHSLVNISTENCEADNILQKNLGKNDQDYFNGDHEMFDSPRKTNRKRKSESDSVTEMDYHIIDGQLEECGDTKRRTRQKRAVSYVEDGTDPVLEMNEDSSPDATPLKKKGRRSKDLKDRSDGESNPSPEQQVLSEPPSSPPTLPLEDSTGKSFNNSPTGCKRGRGVFRGAPRGRGRTLVSLALGTQAEKFPSVTEPLHVDTTLITEPDLRVPGPPPIAPTSCSPDVYDFNDTDSDGVCRGKKGKRGRKKGSSPKKNTKSPLELAKSSISPRPRDTYVKSPRSPKFFSSSRSPITEKHKEWHQGASPPVRDFLKTLSEIPVSESNATSILLQESVTEISKAVQLSEDSLVQDSQSGDTQASDGVTKPDADVVSPRRSSRRNKTRDSQETVIAKGNESMDSNLSNLPSPPLGNLKNNTSFSGLISGSAQSKEEKDDKSIDLAVPKPLPVDGLGSPSNRIRKRGRRSGDQLHPEQQAETQTVLTLAKMEPKCVLEPLKLPEECADKYETDTVEPMNENVGKVETASDDILNSSIEKEIKPLPTKTVGTKVKGKGRGKGKKRNVGRSSKGKSALKKDIVSKITSVLPHESKQYQLVPENAFDDNKTPSGMITTESECSLGEDKPLIQELSMSVPASTIRDITKSESTQHKSRTKRGTDVNMVQSNPLAVDGTSDKPDLESSSQNSMEGTTAVIAQAVEETESQGRRLRTRRASAKQESKSETQDAKSEVQDAKTETKDAKSEAQDTKPETPGAKSEAQDEKSETHDAKSEVQETENVRLLETQGATSEIQDVESKILDLPLEIQDIKSETQEANSKTLSTDSVAQGATHVSEMSVQSVDVSNTEASITAESAPVVPETSSNMSVAPSETLEVPQGTDMDVDAETVENIAKFLEETASSIPAATEETYMEKRPKRSSRIPRKMDENEMNDLLMLLNMEDEESEDEDYVPKDSENFDSTAESDDGGDSDGNYDGEDYESDTSDDCESESRGSGNLNNLLNMASDTTGDNDFVPIALKHGKGGPAKQKGLKKDKGRKVKVDASSAKKGKIIKGKIKSTKSRNDEVDGRKKSEEGRRKGEVCEKRGPFIRLDASRFREVIVNTPYRDEDEQEKPVRKNSIHFYCKIEAKQKTAKVGYNSTLHNNYDAFSKDTSWYCSLCKNYSHSRKLGDLYGPYFIEGLTLLKKQHPQVVEGQVVESSSPSEVGKLKKRTQRRESTSDGPLLENRKLELGGSSPPWRFVPAATPARMLGRPTAKEGGPQQTPDPPNSVTPSITKDSSVKEVVSEENPTTSTTPAVARPPGTECWVHEVCLLWAPGVHVSNSRLCGLEEAVILAQDSICSSCSEAGATVACLGKGCSLMVHVPCATQLQWTLDQNTFRSLCPKHTKPT